MGLSKVEPSMIKLAFSMPFKALHNYQDMAVSVF